jgi:hypothetical protein
MRGGGGDTNVRPIRKKKERKQERKKQVVDLESQSFVCLFM